MTRIPQPSPDRILARLRRRLIGDRRAVSALEFALVGPIFMLFVGMILDSGILLYQQATLDNATLIAARLIRTGQIQQNGGSVTPFTSQLCTDLQTIVAACSDIQYSVTSAAAFASLNGTVGSNGTGGLTGNGTFTPGTTGQDVVVQVAWNRPYIIPWVGNFVNPGGSQMMFSVLAFRNELYD